MSKKRFCQDTTNMTYTEKGIMARSIKAGQDQINFLREQQTKENSETKKIQDDIESHPMKVVKSLEEAD